MSKRTRLKRGSLRFSKFTIVGVINAVVDIGTLNLFLWFAPTRDPQVLAVYNGVALVLANVNSYVWNTLWTFKGRTNHGWWQTLTFAGQALVNIGISNGLFLLLIRPLLIYTEIPAYLVGNVSKVISISVASVIGFFIMRYLVFSHRSRPKGRL